VKKRTILSLIGIVAAAIIIVVAIATLNKPVSNASNPVAPAHGNSGTAPSTLTTSDAPSTSVQASEVLSESIFGTIETPTTTGVVEGTASIAEFVIPHMEVPLVGSRPNLGASDQATTAIGNASVSLVTVEASPSAVDDTLMITELSPLILDESTSVSSAVSASGPLPPIWAKDSDPFIRFLLTTLKGENVGIDVGNWIEVNGTYFWLKIPPVFAIDSHLEETGEVIYLSIGGEDIGRVRVGELYETSFSTGAILDRIIEENLEVLAVESYEIIDNLVVQGSYDSFNVYAIDFSGELCWVVLYSDSSDPESFGPGRFYTFAGWPDERNLAQWAEWFVGLLMTLAI